MGMITCLIFSIVLIGFGDVRAGQCPPRMNCALRFYCPRPSIASVYNVETKMGVIIDTENELSLVFDGNLGKQLFYDHRKSVGVKVTTQTGAWSATKSTVEKYVESVSSLRETLVYKSFSKQSKFQIKTAPNDVISIHRKIIQTLEPDMTYFTEYKKSDILLISINLFKELTMLRTQKLRLFFEKKCTSKSFYINGGLLNVVSTFRGIYSMIKETKKSIETIFLRPDFNLQSIFEAETGTGSFAVIAEQINQTETRVWQNIKYSSIYSIIREFHGGVYKGLRGIEAVIYHCIQFSQKRISLEVFVDVLLQVTASIKQVTYGMLVQKVKDIQKIISTKMSISIFQQIGGYISAFLEDRLIINNVNICTILKKYLIGPSFGLPNVVTILHSFKYNFYSSLTVLFNRMSFFMMTGQASFYILRLIPKLSSLLVSPFVAPIFQITKLLRPQIFLNVREQNFEATMLKIPVLGSIFREITQSLSIVHERKETWIKEITRGASYQSVFGWLKFGMGIQGGVRPMGCVHEMGLWGLARTGCSYWD